MASIKRSETSRLVSGTRTSSLRARSRPPVGDGQQKRLQRAATVRRYQGRHRGALSATISLGMDAKIRTIQQRFCVDWGKGFGQ
jgi:hypothetical protein